MNTKLTIIWALLLSSVCAIAEEREPSEILTVDRSVNQPMPMEFPNDTKVYPMESDFKILNYVLMTSESGERWASVTIKNTSTGNRTLEVNHLHALFANGVRKGPEELKRLFNGSETVTLTLPFGKSKFPILSVYTRR